MSRSTALVTGASSGIGATYAGRLARRGHDVILVARDTARLEALAAQIRADTGRNAEVLTADLTDRGDLSRVQQRLSSDAQISLLVNNAGAALAGPLSSNDPARLDSMIALNITAAVHLARAAVQNFQAQGGGTIINIASILALAPELFNATYGGTKAFVLAFSQGLNAELKGQNIRVQAVLPGATRTEIWERSGAGIGVLPDEMIMEAGDMVDAALAGLDSGELVTIPSLPDVADWQRHEEARQALMPNLSRKHPAARYKFA